MTHSSRSLRLRIHQGVYLNCNPRDLACTSDSHGSILSRSSPCSVACSQRSVHARDESTSHFTFKASGNDVSKNRAHTYPRPLSQAEPRPHCQGLLSPNTNPEGSKLPSTCCPVARSKPFEAATPDCDASQVRPRLKPVHCGDEKSTQA